MSAQSVHREGFVIALERAGLALAAFENRRGAHFPQINRVVSSLREGVSWSDELRMVSVLNLNIFCSVGIEMMMNPVSLEAGNAVVRAYAPRQGRSALRREPQEQARRECAVRARKRDQRNMGSISVLLRARLAELLYNCSQRE
jgi:hypothetical protein